MKITPGQEHENQSLYELLESIDVADHDGHLLPLPEKLAGDKGYRAEWIDDYLLDLGITPVIPSKANAESNSTRKPTDQETSLNDSLAGSKNLDEYSLGTRKQQRTTSA